MKALATLATLVLALALSGCASGPQTPADHLWYGGFLQAQNAGGSCTSQTLRFRDFLHETVGVPYERMRFISSVYEPTRTRHLRLQVYMRNVSDWRTFDPGLNGFNYDENDGSYWQHQTRRIEHGAYKPVEPGGLYHRTELPSNR